MESVEKVAFSHFFGKLRGGCPLTALRLPVR